MNPRKNVVRTQITVSYYKKWVKTSWTSSTHPLRLITRPDKASDFANVNIKLETQTLFCSPELRHPKDVQSLHFPKRRKKPTILHLILLQFTPKTSDDHHLNFFEPFVKKKSHSLFSPPNVHPPFWPFTKKSF